MDSNIATIQISSRSAHSNDERSFHRFADLPFELRLSIWEATTEPQVVHLRQSQVFECYHAVESVSSNRHVSNRCTSSATGSHQGRICEDLQGGAKKAYKMMDRFRGRPYGYHMTGFHTDNPVPSLLLACYESYQVASKLYTKSFSALGSIAQTWFNFKVDTLYLDLNSEAAGTETLVQDVLPYLCQDELAKVQRVAINHDLVSEAMGNYENYLACILVFFTNVKYVYLVSDSKLARDDLPELDNFERLPESLRLYNCMETHRRKSALKDCSDCTAAYGQNGLQSAYGSIGLSADKIQWEGIIICKDRGQVWPKPICVFNKTIATPAMRTKLEDIQQQCATDATCGCYDLGGRASA
ncbi:hypothetical protein LZ554_002800 [Drepanopeziza brunnea f. sp. 'monogermtubi']|nr:hypothetical protein LZ554_002800 [Drepanopeziza brunnea f. sp. 'monogermtubi']